MADQNPPSAPDDKGQTVRINLPAGSEESLEKTAPMGEKTAPMGAPEASKGQTVRINMPPASDSTTAKRETVVISTPPPAAPKKETTHLQTPVPVGAKPVMPPPPVPKPMAPGIPKPPVVGAKPAAPAAAAPVPVAPRPMAPKKETARIQIPPQPKTPLHKATVKLEQPKPASMAPAAAIAVAQAPAEPVVVEDPAVGILSWVVVVASLAAAVISYLAFSA